MSNITVRYSAIDNVKIVRKFSNIEKARDFAVEMIGENPEFGSTYAVSGDGVGKVVVEGISLADLFKKPAPSVLDYSTKFVDDCWVVYYGQKNFTAVGTHQEALEYIAQCREYDAQLESEVMAEFNQGKITLINSMPVDDLPF
jgi:hypothetical protein